MTQSTGISYRESLSARYREARARLWSGTFPNQDPILPRVRRYQPDLPCLQGCNLPDPIIRKRIAQILIPLKSSWGEIGTYTRKPWVIRAREDVWAYLHDECKWSLSKVARLFDRNHTTILTGVRKSRLRSQQRLAS